MKTRMPPDKPCPSCGNLIHAYQSYVSPTAPDADEYDHYWCESCCEAFDFDEVEENENK